MLSALAGGGARPTQFLRPLLPVVHPSQTRTAPASKLGGPRTSKSWDFDTAQNPLSTYLMEVNFRPETESRLQELAQQTGRAPNDLIEDAMAGYLQETCGARAPARVWPRE